MARPVGSLNKSVKEREAILAAAKKKIELDKANAEVKRLAQERKKKEEEIRKKSAAKKLA